MEWIQATSRPCYHHRFPIRLVRRPSPSGTPTSLEQTSQPRTTLMNWRCSTAELRYLVLPERPVGGKKLSEKALAALVTRDAMIGVAKVTLPQAGDHR